ncbi:MULTISPECIES: efflux RND transporter periplasmic adaptor subunit [unclassified Psychrobacter]|uniref:efflux RND transporter periplasmic adaptor subunit n=1 Tax=unclassified Psychrobacter TaxID=196806 RepID=UPI000946AD75|nr:MULTISPECIES: efflux RND transporter periplasmic adaptor subunit [unclassified Psychrobacter]OLF39910.1 efflux transporter periplasmic adaptor subunit [Psychrobacter sp. Rd 27.2]PJX20616.1 efflux transporter periplasmic adaptor subunit [Psychrobacter sp. L7]
MNDSDKTHPKPVNETELPPYRQPSTPATVSAKLPLWLWPVLVVVLVLGVLLGRYWGADKTATDTPTAPNASSNEVGDKAASDAQAVLSVETVMPSQDTIGNTLSADGTISAKDTANVSAKVNGVAVERVLVEEGDRVKAGQVLAVFDTDAMEQQVLQAEADVAEAEATLANASADAARVLPLIDIDAISRQEADRYRTSEVRARASLQAAKARLNSQRLTLDNAKVVAPVSGVISDKMVEVGMVAGGEPLFTIIKGGELEWRADIDPKLVGEVTVGTPVRVSLPDGDSVMGQVSRIAPTADNNRQITIYASLAANAKVRAGMYQTGEFLLGSSNTQTIPNSAVVSNDGYDYVMMVTQIRTDHAAQKTGRIKQQRVSLGERLGDSVAVTEPLPSDSQIVKQGGSFLNDGDLVRIVDGLNQSNNNADTASQARS